MIQSEKELEDQIRLANGELVIELRKDLRDLLGTSQHGTMHAAMEFCAQHGFECDYDQKLDAIEFCVPS